MGISKFLFSIVSFWVFGLASTAWSQVSTAPFGPDQRLVNPAALPYRVLRGYSISANRNNEVALTPGGQGRLETNVDTLGINFGLAPAPYYFEANVLPQFGTEKLESTGFEAGANQGVNSNRDITLIPAQGLLAVRLGDFGSFGVKAFYANAGFSTNQKQYYSVESEGEKFTGSSESKGTRSTEFLLTGFGTVIDLFKSGFYAAASLEFIELKNNTDSIRTTTSSSPSQGTVTETFNEGGKYEKKVQKTVIGLGYLIKFSGGNSWRIDLSQEQMPPLKSSDPFGNPYKDGKLVRLVTEATWSYFHLGVEATSKSGYYVDPYNLIPYFFDTQNLMGESVVEYGFFGGLKSSKGHSFGVSFSQSDEIKEKYYQSSVATPLQTKTLSFGVSYMYAF